MTTPQVATISKLLHKDLLGIEDLTRDEILLILDTAEAMREIGDRPIKKVPALRGKTVIDGHLLSDGVDGRQLAQVVDVTGGL